jgi:hypothetical protein
MEPNTFVFPTDSGWLYSVAFVSNSHLFRGNTLLMNNNLTFEIVFGRSPLDKAAGHKDDLIAITLVDIVLKQFEVFGELPLYFFICDMTDRREAIRAKLFNRWYQNSDAPGWELINYEMQDARDRSITYYAGMFNHLQHPNYELIPDAFGSFLEEDVTAGKLVNRR